MKKVLVSLVCTCLIFLLKLRYSVRVKFLNGINLKVLSRKGGVLFIPNHPAEIDPVILYSRIWGRFRPRPVVDEKTYFSFGIHFLCRVFRAFPMPNFELYTNSYKRKSGEKAMQGMLDALKGGDNILIYPAGRLKRTAWERIGGASAVHTILQEVPDITVVLVRTTGLWGSTFSRALNGERLGFFKALRQVYKKLLYNGIFFMPRRKVCLEFSLAQPDFPFHASRVTLNQYLEKWYNNYAGQDGAGPEDLSLTSFSVWKEDFPEVYTQDESEQIDLTKVPKEIQTSVLAKLADLLSLDVSAIQPELSLDKDLGFDSLDLAEVITFLEDEYDVHDVYPIDLTTVAKVMFIAAGCYKSEHGEKSDLGVHSKVFRAEVGEALYGEGDTIHEVFLHNAERLSQFDACADGHTAPLTYAQVKAKVLILAELISPLPGPHIGIMLPACNAVYLLILACQLCGKVPVMINWTLGPRYLEAMVRIGELNQVLSSWKFLDQLHNVDLSGVDERLVLIEELVKGLSVSKLLRAKVLARCQPSTILRKYSKQMDTAVILFTSGTEGEPKAVPLSHKNILSNHRAAFEVASFQRDTILISALPPFHSFGFSITGLLPLLTGIRVVFYPKPMDYSSMVALIAKWKVTLLASTPMFIKGIIQSANAESLKTIQCFISGGDKLPNDLEASIKSLLPHARLGEGYGVTECSPVISLTPLSGISRGVGRPLPNVDVMLVNPDSFEPVATGKEGLLIIAGESVFYGYYHLNSDFAFVEIGGKKWYISGDIAFFDADGFLFLSGRLKRFVKIAGEMLSLASIELALNETFDDHLEGECPALALSATERPGEKTVLCLFTRLPLDLKSVNEAIRLKGFSNLAKITEVKRVNLIPTNALGKIIYHELGASESS